MPSCPRIDAALPADIPELAGLLGLLFAQEREFVPNLQCQSDGLAAVLASPGIGAIRVARLGGRPIGMVVVLFSISTALGGPVATLEDLVVHPDHRGNGTGVRLLSAALEVAAQRGCLRVSLLTDADNRRAQALYARVGFVASSMRPMRLLLTPEQDGAPLA